ncbi:MAG TPA: TOMM precursor leader peptide-binding protein, partial [Kutzneria sp.]|nr:TOMM precursor leader peptide-binding protein [Kutzneria sp.]
MRRDPQVTVLGKGLLADAIAADPPPLLVAVSDCWDHSGWSQAQELGQPWIPVWTELDRAMIGPVVHPGEPGCAWCLQRWRDCASEQSALTIALRAEDRVLAEPSHWLTEQAGDTVASLLHVATARDSCLIVDLRDLSVSRKRFLPDPLCSTCGSPPVDSRECARIELRPQPKATRKASRIGVLDEPRLTELYADDETGIVATPTGWSDSPLPMAAAALTGYGYRGEAGFGRTRDFTSCRATAIAEALERLGGQWPWGKRTVVRGSYAELSSDAVDPRSFGLCVPERYAEPDCPFQPFTEDAVVSWVWAYSFGQARPVLVPETHAYYRTALQPGAAGEKPFTYEISNGCALGGCLEEAVLHGILEVVERDAFLLTWYARLPVPEVDLPTVPDRRIPLVAERIERTGYRVRVFDTTLAEALPAFFAVAEDTTGDPDRPKVVCTSGSALDPVGGVLTALHELAPVLEQEVRAY